MPKKAPVKPKNGAKIKSGVGVIYARYSSHNQKDASIEQQVAECMEYAREIGLPIIDTYADRAVSGKTDRRPSWQRLMKDAEKGQFQYVLSWKSNRIGRNMLQALMNEARLNELGVCVLYTEEDFDDSAAGRFALRSMMNVNQFYSENMAEDITRGLMDNARQCKSNGSLPFGLKRGVDGRIVVDEAEAEIVREIYRRVSDYEPFADILDDLNARGIKTKKGARWNKGSFTTILHNERYRGIYIYGDVRIEGGVPRIISDPLFFKVQEVCKMKKNPQHTGRRRAGGADYLLTGKLKCGHCGRYMVGMSGTSRSGELHYYYVCQGHKEKTCAKKNVRRDVIERAVAQAIMMYCLTDETIEDLQNVVRALVKKGAMANTSCGIHVHVDGANHTPESLSRLLNFAIGRQDLFYEALQIGDRANRWCHKISPELFKAMKQTGRQSRDAAEHIWYSPRNDGYEGGISHSHYNTTRYHGINLHAFFTKGTVEFRLFNGTTHAGKIKAYIQFCLAMSAWAINCDHDDLHFKRITNYTQEQKAALMKRVLINRLGMRGPEFKTARLHLTSTFAAETAQAA